MTLLEQTLEHHAGHLDAPAVQELDDLLARLSATGATPSIEGTDRAAECRRQLICRCSPVKPEQDLELTLALARRLVLESADQKALAPWGYLVQRVAGVDLPQAADLLVEGSNAVASIKGPKKSWKARRARRWRTAMLAVIPLLPTREWTSLVQRLVAHDPAILGQVLDVSMTHRVHPNPAAVEELLSGVEVGADIQGIFRAAAQRRQRRVGGDLIWLELLERWWATKPLDVGTGDGPR